jgi:hypothetical protein
VSFQGRKVAFLGKKEKREIKREPDVTLKVIICFKEGSKSKRKF